MTGMLVSSAQNVWCLLVDTTSVSETYERGRGSAPETERCDRGSRTTPFMTC
jgi:hypothetical protein